jgi:hypothetical protein
MNEDNITEKEKSVCDRINTQLFKDVPDVASISADLIPIPVPTDLHRLSQVLAVCFGSTLAYKLLAAQKKYGYTDGWANPGWGAECRKHLRKHLEKGDPRDVAIYAMFLWYLGEPTNETTNIQSDVQEPQGDGLRTCQVDQGG